MTECTSKNIWYVKKRKKKSKILLKCILIICIIVGCTFYYRQVVSNNIYQICADYAYSYSTESVNKAVILALKDKINYDDLIDVEKDNDGKIFMLTANSLRINVISREVVNYASEILKENIDKGIPVPLLAFTGIGIISGYGGTINLKTASITSVTCEFYSKFQSVGINQTLHSIL